MVYWCKEFLDKVKTATEEINDFRMYLQKIYVDDQNNVCEALPPGLRLVNGKVVVVESEVEGDKELPSDVRTSYSARNRHQCRSFLSPAMCEALRWLRYFSRELPWAEKSFILSNFSHKLMLSGWDAGT